MKFTFENVYDNRLEFQIACDKYNLGSVAYNTLINAVTGNDFMQIIYDNFSWINDHIEDFEPKFTYAFNFQEDLSVVYLNNKWGCIKKDGTYLVKPIYQEMTLFQHGVSKVLLHDKYGILKNNGKYFIEPMCEYIEIDYYKETFFCNISFDELSGVRIK